MKRIEPLLIDLGEYENSPSQLRELARKEKPIRLTIGERIRLFFLFRDMKAAAREGNGGIQLNAERVTYNMKLHLRSRGFVVRNSIETVYHDYTPVGVRSVKILWDKTTLQV